jgi:hypothetical protein
MAWLGFPSTGSDAVFHNRPAVLLIAKSRGL